MSGKVLFVDDESHITQALSRALRKEPYSILTADSAPKALSILKRERIDVVVSDEAMPRMPGSEFLKIVSAEYPDTIRIMLTGHPSLETAVKAINEGQIYRFLRKPANALEISVTIRQALQQRELLARSRRLLRTVRKQSSIIEELERENPGLTKVNRDQEGSIVIDDVPKDMESFLTELRRQTGEAETPVRQE